jgi:uncharacterized coiled-coil protein SlyX
VDADIGKRFDKLEGALVKLTEGLTQTNAAVVELAHAQTRTDEHLATLTERVDRLAQLMIRGPTEAAERHAAIIDRLDRLEEK